MKNRGQTGWQSVHDQLLRDIRERRWRPGDRLPDEVDLAIDFDCSRTTINRAMRELAKAGIVERRRRAGTRVSMHPVGRAKLEIPVIRLEVEARGSVWRQMLLERALRRPPAGVAAKMRLDRSQNALYLRSLHFADEQPLLFEDRWINTDFLPTALDIDFQLISANEWLVQNAAYTTGDMVFTAANADPEQAELLETKIGTALLIADRTTWDADIAITVVRLFHAPGYRLRAAL